MYAKLSEINNYFSGINGYDAFDDNVNNINSPDFQRRVLQSIMHTFKSVSVYENFLNLLHDDKLSMKQKRAVWNNSKNQNEINIAKANYKEIYKDIFKTLKETDNIENKDYLFKKR